MKNKNQNKIVNGLLYLLLTLTACSLGQPLPAPVPTALSPTVAASDTTPPGVPLEATNTEDVIVTMETATYTPITHYSYPGQPAYLENQLIFDCSSGFNYVAGQPARLNRGCDAWVINFMERPFPTQLDAFFPYVDIELAQMGYDFGWFYGRIRVYEPTAPLDGDVYTYLFELDGGFDGRGDVLIAVENLPVDAFTWSVVGVRAWRDDNGDVGSKTPIRSDPENSGDGYETLIFDQGAGNDPDLVWARRAPGKPKWIEFAFKPSLLKDDQTFLWWAWAIKGAIDPARFDLVDGKAERYGLDNTCTMEFNSSPSGFANGCRVIQPTPTLEPGCVKPAKPNSDPCWLWFQDRCQWICMN